MQEEKSKNMYTVMLNLFNMNADSDLYDVDMYRTDICDALFTETDPHSIPEDDFTAFQEALIMLVGTEELIKYFGYSGLAVLHADIMYDARNYYINKKCWKEA